MPFERICVRCLQYGGAVLLLAEMCHAIFAQPFSTTEYLVNMPAVGGLRTVDPSGILPSWVPVRPIAPGSFIKTADTAEVWPSLLNNLWHKTEIALFVSPSLGDGAPSHSRALNTVKRVFTAARRFPRVRVGHLSYPV
jgi:hypothetical protein